MELFRLSWPEPLSQHLVLWVAMFGAIAASAEHRHIAIDVVSYVLPERVRRFIDVFISLLTAAICVVFTWFSIVFVVDEIRNGSPGVTFFGLRSSWLTVILPVGFALLALRSVIVFISSIGKLRRPVASKTLNPDDIPSPEKGSSVP